ncbi:MAG: hypothetical protein B6D68_01040 [spirochete symbiont of Stewartia floridana]|nr:MAG: hypothetical protein B6D68_01040 [spirochete symbiont of Stewartia floridana]
MRGIRIPILKSSVPLFSKLIIWAHPFGSGFPLQCLIPAACSRLIANRRGSRRHFRFNPLRCCHFVIYCV